VARPEPNTPWICIVAVRMIEQPIAHRAGRAPAENHSKTR
jgi:hypothetical protein